MPEVTPICQFGTKAISFSLNGIDNQIYSLEQIKGKNGTLVFFICNHCPYVKGVIDRLVSDIENLQKKGIGSSILSIIEKKLYNLGCAKINLFVRNTNIKVKAFYKTNNYEMQDSQIYGKRLIKDN